MNLQGLPTFLPSRPRLAATIGLASLLLAAGCTPPPPKEYGREGVVTLSTSRPQVWAVAPAINLSGQPSVDPLLQADLVFQQLQQIQGLTVIPVDRVVGVYVALGIDQVQSAEQAMLVCERLGADALVVPAVTAWEPYDPPKMGATLSLFTLPGSFSTPADVDPRVLARRATPLPGSALPAPGPDGFYQASGMYDAANGTVREALFRHAHGRTEPLGPFGAREFLVSSDRYASFVYRQLTLRLFDQLFHLQSPALAAPRDGKSEFPAGGPPGPQPFPSNRR